KSLLFTLLWTFLAFNLFSYPALSDSPGDLGLSGTLRLGSIPSTPQPFGSIHQSGPLPNETGYWLRLDKPIYVLKGSKSEASTDIIVLRVPKHLQEKSGKLEGKQVTARGTMKCTGNWREGASCELLVKQIDLVVENTQKLAE
ncbi:MAG: hypothetical protein C0407_03795, partial [Desulfobacca sp.]|nr:hypothetical protein [Desulfobacca sp.]